MITRFQKRTKIIFACLTVFLIVAIITTSVLLITRDPGLKVRALEQTGGELVPSSKVSEYSKSRLYLHKNGTFTIEIIYLEDQKYFFAIGTFKKGKTVYEMTFLDAWMINDDSEFKRDPYLHDIYINSTREYKRVKGRIEFKGHTGIFFYFK